MTDNWLLTLFSFVFGLGGPLGVYILVRKELRQTPIEYNTAQVADAIAVSTASRSLMDTMMSRLSQQDDKINGQGTRIEKLTRIVEGWDDFYDDLSFRWEVHRTKPTPPPPPTFSDTHAG